MSAIRPFWLLKTAAFSIFLCVGNSVLCSADPQSAPPAKAIQFEGDPPFTPKPLTLQGYLRHPDDTGRHPAVVLLHGCGGHPERLDENWGEKIASWGYVTLTIDSFGPRGIGNICGSRFPRDQDFDAYRGLNFLIRQPFVDAKRVVVVGFSQGGSLAIFAVERGGIEQTTKNKFRAAVAFYPICDGLSGISTVPTLILIGERDEWTPNCRDMVNGRDDWDKSRKMNSAVRLVTYADAYQGFDDPRFTTPFKYGGKYIRFNQSATGQSTAALQEFLNTTVGGPQ
jgi:dienelactone hydrolase